MKNWIIEEAQALFDNVIATLKVLGVALAVIVGVIVWAICMFLIFSSWTGFIVFILLVILFTGGTRS